MDVYCLLGGKASRQCNEKMKQKSKLFPKGCNICLFSIRSPLRLLCCTTYTHTHTRQEVYLKHQVSINSQLYSFGDYKCITSIGFNGWKELVHAQDFVTGSEEDEIQDLCAILNLNHRKNGWKKTVKISKVISCGHQSDSVPAERCVSLNADR